MLQTDSKGQTGQGPTNLDLNIFVKMTEYSSDDDERRGRSSSDLTPDDFDFDIGNYSQQQNNFFNRFVIQKQIIVKKCIFCLLSELAEKSRRLKGNAPKMILGLEPR